MQAFGGGDVVKLYGALEEDASGWESRAGPPAVNLFIEAADSTLFTEVLSHDDKSLIVDKNLRMRMLVELLRGLIKFEQGNWVHRDVKPRNIFVFGDCASEEGCHGKVGDMGLSCPVVEAGWHDVVGSPLYVAPEVWRDEADRSKIDVWSAGMVAFQLFAGRVPETFSQIDCDEAIAEQVTPYGSRDIIRNFNIQEDILFNYLKEDDAEMATFIAKMLANKACQRWRGCAGGVERISPLWTKQSTRQLTSMVITGRR